MTVLAIHKWPTNGALIADCARLGYLQADWRTLDPTYGYGTFWAEWKPKALVASDIDIHKSPIGRSADFTDLRYLDECFDAAAFDPPYKLNGTPTDTGGMDERFGVGSPTRWQDRMALILDGCAEVARVTRHNVLVKCQDQVVSGKIRWQTVAVTERMAEAGFGLRDRFDFLSHRPQPMEGRTQRTAHRCSSQLLVFTRGWKS